MVLPRFLSELQRRKVYRVALVYTGVGWALLEMADVILPRLGLPDWSVNLVLAIVLLGFPLSLVFAWIFDFSPQGIVRTPPLSQGHQHSFSVASIVEFVLIVVLVAAVGGLYWDRLSLQKRLAEFESGVQGKLDIEKPLIPAPEQYRAIAVLPFADMSESKDQAWFAEGIAEELLIALSQVKQLSVMARTSSFAFKDTDKTVAEIADILGVQAVLEGSVRRSGDRVRVTAQLVAADTGFHLWSGSYERQITDIFQLQDELAKSVVAALRIELGVESSVPLVVQQTQVPEAYDWFIRGRALSDWAGSQDLIRSISYFEKAVEADPRYAIAWGHLSAARSIMMAFRPVDEVGPSVIAALEAALALDPEQSEALATKALMTQLLDRDWATAGRLYQRATASSETAWATAAYAFFYLQFIERQAQAIALLSRVEQLDPLHAGAKANLASVLYFAGDYAGAIRKAREALQLDPEHMPAIRFLIVAYTAAHEIEALELLLGSIPPALQERAEIQFIIGRSYAVQGDEGRARKIYDDLVTSVDGLSPWANLGIIRLALSLGEVEESIDLMERLEKSGSYMMFWIKLLPEAAVLKEHPRYQAILKRIGLDDDSVAALNKQISFD